MVKRRMTAKMTGSRRLVRAVKVISRVPAPWASPMWPVSC
jgi:hypothetical protein